MKPNRAAAPDAWQYRDYVLWDEGRWELVDGEAFDMSPAPAIAHQQLVMALGSELNFYFADKKCQVLGAPFDVLLPETGKTVEETRTVLQPDLAVVCDPEQLKPGYCLGAPTWVIEILSPRTAARDQIKKRLIYERHGVALYWLLHAEDRILTIYRRQADGRFAPPQILEAAGDLEVAEFPGLVVHWPRVFQRLASPS